MAKTQYSEHDKKLWIGIGVTVVFLILGILFLVNAMGIANFYSKYAALENALAKYIVVIATMALGIMGWCNIALRFEDKKTRDALTISMTAFAFILTLPLTYVFFSLMPFNAHFTAEQVSIAGGAAGTVAGFTNPDQVAASAEALGLNAIDKTMGVNNIYLGFAAIFGEGAGLWVILSIMMIVGVVFLLEPLAAGICVVKGKILNIFGKNDAGKFGLIRIATLPVIKKQQEQAKAEEKVEEKTE